MKKLLIASLGLLCASILVVQAQQSTNAVPKKHKELTVEQQALMKQMLAKYDTNKDGKLDKTERAAMKQEDKDAMVKAGLSKSPKQPDAAAPAKS